MRYCGCWLRPSSRRDSIVARVHGSLDKGSLSDPDGQWRRAKTTWQSPAVVPHYVDSPEWGGCQDPWTFDCGGADNRLNKRPGPNHARCEVRLSNAQALSVPSRVRRHTRARKKRELSDLRQCNAACRFISSRSCNGFKSVLWSAGFQDDPWWSVRCNVLRERSSSC